MIKELHTIVKSMERDWAGKRLLVVGDVMLDKYIEGDVERISPEAPVPVVQVSRQSEQPGGAANVAMNLVRLGAEPVLVGFTGEDEDAALLARSLSADGILFDFVSSAGFPTTTKLRVLGGRQQMLRLDREQTGERAAADYDRLLQRALEHLPSCCAVVLSDYAKGTLTAAVCQTIIQAARQLGLPVLVDPKSSDFSRYRGATTICPNLSELMAALQMEDRDLESVLVEAEGIVPQCALDFLVVTLSEKGIAVVSPDGHFLAPAVARQVFDVSGAGDTVIAVLALCLASQLPPEVAARLANLAAGIVVGKVGTVPVEKHELLSALTPEIVLHSTSKILSLQELRSRIALWRANQERVVFTNGCFDLLHVGHITLLEEARSAGDRLVVAVNSDASVCSLKGSDRPIVGENERARVLAALAAVDAVLIFDEPTPLELILALRPDVLVKGGDYELDSIVGATEVASWGGLVMTVPCVDGASTTRLIARSAGR